MNKKVEGIAKAKELTVFLIGVKNVCAITCTPRQKWKFTRTGWLRKNRKRQCYVKNVVQ